MHNTLLNNLLLIFILALFSCTSETDNNADIDKSKFYTQGIYNRTAAEWEPALGTLIVWPLGLPHKLVIELAKDNHLYTMVENKDSRKEAEKWFFEWEIDLDQVTFIYAIQGVDSWWTRDWGPSAVFTSTKDYYLADGKYIYSTPTTDMACNDSLRFLFYDENNKIELTQEEDDATIPLAKQLGYNLLDLPFNNTGGNVATDGLGTAFSSCVIYTENDFHGIDKLNFLNQNDSLLGFKQYNILSNFENSGIQHIDCLLKIIDEETIIVAEPPSDHELFDVYNKIVADELSVLKNSYGKSYKILRIKTDRYYKERLAAYTNSLILNETVYIPLFDIAQDTIAIQTWQNAMPGYKIKGFKFFLADEPYVTEELKEHYNTYGWNSGDALHCRTRAIWNPEMLYITVNTIPPIVDADQKTNVYATIIDYSNKGLIENKNEMHWHLSGETEWNSITLTQSGDSNHYFAQIPNHGSGTHIEYYISATSKSGEAETRPKTAPTATYKFSIR